MLFFNRPIKRYLPNCTDDTPPFDSIVRKSQNEKYQRIKEYSDKNRNHRQLTLNIGYNIIMERGGFIKKEDSEFYTT